MRYRLFFGILDTKKGFLFDADWLFMMKTQFGMPPQVIMPMTKDWFIEKYKEFLND